MNEWLIVGALAILLVIFFELDRPQQMGDSFQSADPAISRSLPHSN
jgi:hypothetical protein